MNEQWWVRGPDGAVAGPYDTQGLLAAVQRGAVPASVEVSGDGVMWAGVMVHPGFQRAVSAGQVAAAPWPVAPPPSTSSSNPALWILLAVALFVPVVAGVVWLVVRSAPAAPPSAPAAAADPARTQLAHVSMSRLRRGPLSISVCSRTPLHHCTVSFGGDGIFSTTTYRTTPADIGAVDVCDGIGQRALAACADAGTIYDYNGPTAGWMRCLERNGLVYRGSQNMARVDPREDTHALGPDLFHLQCDEGFYDAEFAPRP